MAPTTPQTVTMLLMLGIAVVGSNSLALSPILPDVAASLLATPVQVARANAAYGGATAVSALLLGPLVDRLGARRVLVAGLGLLAGAMVGSAAATGWLLLAVAQGVAGVAAGLVLPATYAYATVAAPPGREAETLGRVLTGWSVSLVAGVPLSALIAETAGWRASYGLLAVLLLAASAGFARVREPAAAPAGGRDRSLLPALRSPGVPALLAVCFAFMTAFYGVYSFMGDHMRQVLGVSSGAAGLVVLAYGLGFGLASLGDRVVDRVGAGRLFPFVLGALTPVFVLMISGSGSFPAMLALAAAWGFANHFGLNILVLLLGRADPARRGAVLALNSAVSYAGALAGASVFGVLYEWGGFRPLAGVAAACVAGAAVVAAAVRPARDAGPG